MTKKPEVKSIPQLKQEINTLSMKRDWIKDETGYANVETLVSRKSVIKKIEGFEKQELEKNEKAKKQGKGGFRFTDTRNQSYWRGYLKRGKEILEK